MKSKTDNQRQKELAQLCELVREMTAEGRYEDCVKHICSAMERYPHAPHPHNLLGIVLEKTGDHITAMKHFRAAWALDPTYLPTSYNLNTYGAFFSNGKCAFDESDVPESVTQRNLEVVYDERGVGRIVPKNEARQEENGSCGIFRR